MGVFGAVGGLTKVLGRIADNTHLNSWMVAGSLAAMSSNGIQTVLDGVQDAHALDPNTFERASSGVGNTLGGAVDVSVATSWAIHGAKRAGAIHEDAFMSRSGKLHVNNNGVVSPMNNGKLGAALGEAEGKALMNNASARGVIGRGPHGWNVGARSGFLKNAGKGMMIGSVVAPLAMHMVLAPVLGFAGKLVDEMYHQSREARRMKYDERYIVNQQQDQSTQQQVGAAIDTYQNKMMSLSRIYHSR